MHPAADWDFHPWKQEIYGRMAKRQVGKHYGRNKPFIYALVLAICAALASGGCAGMEQDERRLHLYQTMGPEPKEEDQAEQGARISVQSLPIYII